MKVFYLICKGRDLLCLTFCAIGWQYSITKMHFFQSSNGKQIARMKMRHKLNAFLKCGEIICLWYYLLWQKHPPKIIYKKLFLLSMPVEWAFKRKGKVVPKVVKRKNLLVKNEYIMYDIANRKRVWCRGILFLKNQVLSSTAITFCFVDSLRCSLFIYIRC